MVFLRHQEVQKYQSNPGKIQNPIHSFRAHFATPVIEGLGVETGEDEITPQDGGVAIRFSFPLKAPAGSSPGVPLTSRKLPFLLVPLLQV